LHPELVLELELVSSDEIEPTVDGG